MLHALILELNARNERKMYLQILTNELETTEVWNYFSISACINFVNHILHVFCEPQSKAKYTKSRNFSVWVSDGVTDILSK